MSKKALWDKEGNNITWIDAVERCLQQVGHPMRVKDIYECMLCSNCHRMVHRIRSWIKDKKELKKIVMITDV